MPESFPLTAYNAVHQRVEPTAGSNPTAFVEYAGGFSAVSYRFKAVCNADIRFREGLEKGARYVQECAIFDFFVTGLSTLESFCYALYGIGAIVKPNDFSLTESSLEGVKPELVRDKFGRHFKDEEITKTLKGVCAHPTFREWKRIRNVLAHRVVPGRIISAQVSFSGRARVVEDTPDVWSKEGLTLNQNLTISRRKWLASRVTKLCVDTHTFTARKLN